MRFLIDEMYAERVADLLRARGHDAAHVRSIGLGGAPDAVVLAHAAEDDRVVVTENASDFLPLLDERMRAGDRMTPVLIALTRGRGVGGALHDRLAGDIAQWASSHEPPYAHAHWLS